LSTLNFSEQAQHAELAAAAYNPTSAGNAGPPDTSNLEHLEETYIIKTEHAVDGDVVYSFQEIETGEIFVVVRGTDHLPIIEVPLVS